MHLPRSLPLALALAGTVSGFKCPKSDIKTTKCLGPKDCLYANPKSCKNFIQCIVNADGVTGTPVVMPCPAGLEWNNKGKICDWPQNSTCGDEIEILEDEVQEVLPPSDGSINSSFSCSDAQASQGCMGSSGEGIECIYANPANSKSYIQCTDGIAYTVQCKSGEYRDVIKACENPEK